MVKVSRPPFPFSNNIEASQPLVPQFAASMAADVVFQARAARLLSPKSHPPYLPRLHTAARAISQLWIPKLHVDLPLDVDFRAPLLDNALVNTDKASSGILTDQAFSRERDFLIEIRAKLLVWEKELSTGQPLSKNRLALLISTVRHCLEDFFEAYAGHLDADSKRLQLAYTDFFINDIQPSLIKLLRQATQLLDIEASRAASQIPEQIIGDLVQIYNTLSDHVHARKSHPDEIWFAASLCRDTVAHDLIDLVASFSDVDSFGIDVTAYQTTKKSRVRALIELHELIYDKCQNLESSILHNDSDLIEHGCDIANKTTQGLNDLLGLLKFLQHQTKTSAEELVLQSYWESTFYPTLDRGLLLLACVTPTQDTYNEKYRVSLIRLKRVFDLLLDHPVAAKLDLTANLNFLYRMYLVPACLDVGFPEPARKTKMENLHTIATIHNNHTVTNIFRNVLSINSLSFTISYDGDCREEYEQIITQADELLKYVNQLACIQNEHFADLTQDEMDTICYIFHDFVLPTLDNVFHILITMRTAFWHQSPHDNLSELFNKFATSLYRINSLLGNSGDVRLVAWGSSLESGINAVYASIQSAPQNRLAN